MLYKNVNTNEYRNHILMRLMIVIPVLLYVTYDGGSEVLQGTTLVISIHIIDATGIIMYIEFENIERRTEKLYIQLLHRIPRP